MACYVPRVAQTSPCLALFVTAPSSPEMATGITTSNNLGDSYVH